MLRRCSWRLTRRSVAEEKDRQPAIPKGLSGEGPATAVSTRLSGFRKACFARWIMITCLLALCPPLLTAEFLSSLVGLLWQSNGYFGAVRVCSNRTNLAPSYFPNSRKNPLNQSFKLARAVAAFFLSGPSKTRGCRSRGYGHSRYGRALFQVGHSSATATQVWALSRVAVRRGCLLSM